LCEPFVKAIEAQNSLNPLAPIRHILAHTGQHYDVRMSEAFFRSLGIPDPDINLEIGSGSHAEQVGHTTIAFEKVLVEEKPDWVVVVGDVNATLACSVAAKNVKRHRKMTHHRRPILTPSGRVCKHPARGLCDDRIRVP
jgi:UDP-N-acetylglucosamine 2-epimerase (non-hydrolysing)